jgi:hypothetical protein
MNQQDQPKVREEWFKQVEQQEKSGLSQKDFCQQQGLVLSQFVYYRCLLKNKEKEKVAKKTSFQSVKLVNQEPTSKSEEIRLTLPNGFQCAFPAHLEAARLKQLVEVLLAC